MKTSNEAARRRWLQAGAGACLLGAFGLAHAQTVVRISRLENVPDQFLGGEMLVAIYKRLGITVEFVDLPAKRSLLESSEGRVDGEVQRILAVQEQYPTLLAVQPSFNSIEPAAFVRSGVTLRVDGWKSIAQHSIGIVRGVGSSERGTQGMASVQPVTTMENLMQSLDAGRFDVAVNDRFSGLLVIRKLGLEGKVQPVDPPLEHIPLHHFLHERHRDLVPKVGQVIRTMQASGELERVRQQVMDTMLAAVKR
ncbi:substrate-binding periplasmic protein [Ideonella sp. YS5]|uniref:substrate-binding periplasmic protein n=1 Tax=Ideonella sp. YS5 TaxID=3453714 RepID=UPI003EEF516D